MISELVVLFGSCIDKPQESGRQSGWLTLTGLPRTLDDFRLKKVADIGVEACMGPTIIVLPKEVFSGSKC